MRTYVKKQENRISSYTSKLFTSALCSSQRATCNSYINSIWTQSEITFFFVEVGHLNMNWPYANIWEKTRKSYFQLYQQVIHQRIVHFTVRHLQYVYQFNMKSGNNIFFVEVGHLNMNWPYANICEKTRKSYFQLYQQVIHQRIVQFTVRDLQYVYQFNMNSIGNNIFFVEVGHLNRNWPYANICEKTRKSYFQLYQQVIHQRIVHFTVGDLQYVYQFNMKSIGNNIFFCWGRPFEQELAICEHMWKNKKIVFPAIPASYSPALLR